VKRILALLLLSYLLSSCIPAGSPIRAEPRVDIIPLKFSLLQDRTIIERFDPPGAGSQLEMTVGLGIKNPNSFGINLKEIKYQIALAGVRVEEDVLEPDYYIRAGGEAAIDYKLKTSVKGKSRLIKAIARAFTGTPIDFKMDGETVFDSLTHEFRSRAETIVSGQVAVRNKVLMPILELDNKETKIYSLRADAPVIKIQIKANNPGEVGYFVYGQEVVLTMDGQFIMSQDVALSALPAAKTSFIEMYFYPDLQHMPDLAKEAIADALNGKPVPFSLTGDILVDVLGIETYTVTDGWNIYGSVSNHSPQ